jgi:predicted Na+-dependent transporter
MSVMLSTLIWFLIGLPLLAIEAVLLVVFLPMVVGGLQNYFLGKQQKDPLKQKTGLQVLAIGLIVPAILPFAFILYSFFSE